MHTSRSPLVEWPSLPGRPCSVAASLHLLGEKWSLLALREISYGNRRFVDIVRNTGAPKDRLAARLRHLEEAGVIERRLYQHRPDRYEYVLTEAGADLSPVLHALVLWGDRWLADTPPVTFEHTCGEPLEQVTVCRACGVEVSRDDTTLHVDVRGWDRSGPIEGRDDDDQAGPASSA